MKKLGMKPFSFNDSVKQMSQLFKRKDENAMRMVQLALDSESGVSTLPILQADFLAAHKVAMCRCSGLIEVMADCLKTAVTGKLAAAAYPIEVAADGTMTMQPDDLLIKSFKSMEAFEENFGDTRLGIAVACNDAKLLRYQVIAGPFIELLAMVKNAAGA